MQYSSYDMKDKYPYWWANKEKEEREREIEQLLEYAKMDLDLYINRKIEEIENKVKDIVINVEANIGGRKTTIDAIGNEVRNMLYDELKRAFR